jgi:6-phosphogluconolactonase (cycloisomerase 2 family)
MSCNICINDVTFWAFQRFAAVCMDLKSKVSIIQYSQFHEVRNMQNLSSMRA